VQGQDLLTIGKVLHGEQFKDAAVSLPVELVAKQHLKLV